MPYDLIIKEMPEGKENKYKIEELKELRDILLKFKDKTIEVDLYKIKVK